MKHYIGLGIGVLEEEKKIVGKTTKMKRKKKMKIWKYNYNISYGNGQGIIIANTKERALYLLKEDFNYKYYKRKSELKEFGFDEPNERIEEIDLDKEQLIDTSWQE